MKVVDIRKHLMKNYPAIYKEIEGKNQEGLKDFLEANNMIVEETGELSDDNILESVEAMFLFNYKQNVDDDSGFDKRFSSLEALIKLDSEDRENARDLYLESGKSTSWFKAHFMEILTVIILTLTALYFNALMGLSPEESTGLVNVTEFIKNVIILVVGFFFGSSAGSKSKDVILDKHTRDE